MTTDKTSASVASAPTHHRVRRHRLARTHWSIADRSLTRTFCDDGGDMLSKHAVQVEWTCGSRSIAATALGAARTA